MTQEKISVLLEEELKRNDGILRLDPAWVARDFLPPGKRLGLPESEYNLGDRGGICERWVGSTTPADNAVKVENEGLSFISFSNGEKLALKDAVESAPELLMGKEYASTHKGLSRLPKIFDYEERLPYHIHQMEKHAKLVGCNSKEEAYYFPETKDRGKHPETFFGVHPYITEEKKYDVLLEHLTEWKDDSILKHARAYLQLPDDGFHIPAGILHAPGTALTIELQEDSDVFAMMQAKVGEHTINKELLYKDVRAEDRNKHGEKILLEMVDWQLNGDPYFYENRHTPPVPVEGSEQEGGKEYWIFYNTEKFSGKKLVVYPGQKYVSRDNGVYNILVWQGKGIYGGMDVEAFNFGYDELLITQRRAVKETEIQNTGNEELIIFKFFGPDINTDIPRLNERK